VIATPVPDPQIEYIARIDGTDPVHYDVFYDTPIHGRKGNRGTVGVKNGQIGNFKIPETTPGGGTKFRTIGTGTAHAILHDHLLANFFRIPGFEANHIVSRI